MSKSCKTCGMGLIPNEYHPPAACLMFKGCRNSEIVREEIRAMAQSWNDHGVSIACEQIGRALNLRIELKPQDETQKNILELVIDNKNVH